VIVTLAWLSIIVKSLLKPSARHILAVIAAGERCRLEPGDQQIRVYRKGPGTLARVIDAILEPSVRGDEVLRDLGSDDTRETLAQIRRLVGAAS